MLWEQAKRKVETVDLREGDPFLKEIGEKVEEIKELGAYERGILIASLMKHRHIFRKIPGHFKSYE